MSCDFFSKIENFNLKLRLSLGSNEAIKQAVASGLGLSVVSVHSINPQWHIVILKGKKLLPIATIFHDHLLSAAKKISASQA